MDSLDVNPACNAQNIILNNLNSYNTIIQMYYTLDSTLQCVITVVLSTQQTVITVLA